MMSKTTSQTTGKFIDFSPLRVTGRGLTLRSSSVNLGKNLQQCLHQAASDKKSLGLLLAYIPGFRRFTGIYGHDAAQQILGRLDSILQKTANSLLPVDSLLYFGVLSDNEFIFLVNGQNPNRAALTDWALRMRMDARFQLNQEAVRLTGQNLDLDVGCAMLSRHDDQDMDAWFNQALGQARLVAADLLNQEGLSLLAEFRKLIETPKINAVYQPIVDLASGQPLGWEALARGPQGSYFQSPIMMFDFAEETGSLFHLERTCREQAVCRLEGLQPHQKLFVNIHPQTLADPDFRAGETKRLLKKHGLEPANVVFEITERHSIHDFTLFYRTLEHYRSQGFQVAIDDAGTGYSGLSRIANLRPDYIKADMSLVRGIDSNPVQRALLEALVTLANKIGSAIIAEGIETETELSCLCSMGVHYGQGYYLARPANPKPHPVDISAHRTRKNGSDPNWKCSIPVRELAEPGPQVHPAAKVRDIKTLLDNNPISSVVVVDDNRPVGLVMSHALDRQLGTQYGTALYFDRSVDLVMDQFPLIVDGDQPVEDVAKLAMGRDRFKIYDHVIVTENGKAHGLVSVQKILDALARVQVEMAKGASPLTGLPGGLTLEREIERHCNNDEPVSFIYVDLDHFKVYNDTYGFKAGDRMINLMAHILTWAAKRHAPDFNFLGHVGGDDFVVICAQDRAERVCQAVVRCFKRLVPDLYNEKDAAAGFVTAKGRDGAVAKYNLVSVSLGIVDCAGRCDLQQIGHRAAEIKCYAKSISGNSYVRDRRRPLSHEDDEEAA